MSNAGPQHIDFSSPQKTPEELAQADVETAIRSGREIQKNLENINIKTIPLNKEALDTLQHMNRTNAIFAQQNLQEGITLDSLSLFIQNITLSNNANTLLQDPDTLESLEFAQMKGVNDVESALKQAESKDEDYRNRLALAGLLNTVLGPGSPIHTHVTQTLSLLEHAGHKLPLEVKKRIDPQEPFSSTAIDVPSLYASLYDEAQASANISEQIVKLQEIPNEKYEILNVIDPRISGNNLLATETHKASLALFSFDKLSEHLFDYHRCIIPTNALSIIQQVVFMGRITSSVKEWAPFCFKFINTFLNSEVAQQEGVEIIQGSIPTIMRSHLVYYSGYLNPMTVYVGAQAKEMGLVDLASNILNHLPLALPYLIGWIDRNWDTFDWDSIDLNP